jgi:hypothetical protein
MKKILLTLMHFLLFATLWQDVKSQNNTVSIFFMRHFDNDSIKVFYGKDVANLKLKTNESIGGCKQGIVIPLDNSPVIIQNVTKKISDSFFLKKDYGYLYIYFTKNKFKYMFEKSQLSLE